MLIRIALVFLLISNFVFAQENDNISKWTVKLSKPAAKAGDEVEILFLASIDKNWKLYSSDFKGEIGPLPTEFKFDENAAYQLIGDITPINPKKTVDPTWDVAYTYFTEKAEFRQKIRLKKGDFAINGTIKGLLCSNEDGLCVPFTETFRVN